MALWPLLSGCAVEGLEYRNYSPTAIEMTLWPPLRGCAVGGCNNELLRAQRSEWLSGVSRGAAQWGVGISEYLARRR
eukprot:5351697-Alexandrium_andersonii.AAC.1